MNPTMTESERGESKARGHRSAEAGERERVVAEWAASGKKVEEVAVETGWSVYTLYRWRADIREQKAPKKQEGRRELLPVPKPASSMTGTGAWTAEVMVDTGLSVRLSAGCTPAWAAQLVRELKRC